MAIQFDTIRNELRSRMGNRTDIEDRMVRWINYAFQEIVLNPRYMYFELDQSGTFQTAVGDRSYQIYKIVAEDIWFLLDVRDNTNQRKLRRTHWSYIDKIVDTTGAPVRYYRWGREIYLDPIPDAAYTIQLRYKRRPQTIGPGSTFENVGDEWEETFVTLAAIKGYEALGLQEQAGIQRQLLEQLISSKVDLPGLEDYDSENTVEVSITPRY